MTELLDNNGIILYSLIGKPSHWKCEVDGLNTRENQYAKSRSLLKTMFQKKLCFVVPPTQGNFNLRKDKYYIYSVKNKLNESI